MPGQEQDLRGKQEEKKMENKTYWEKLKEARTKISVQTKDRKYYSGFVKDCNELGIFFIDKFNNEVFFSYDNIMYMVPCKSNGNSEGEI